MKYAVIKINGLQYKASEGDKIEVDGFLGEKGREIDINEVLLFVENGKVRLGKPVLKGENVRVEVLKQKPGEKIVISKFKAKTGYRRKRGFRPRKTLLQIKQVSA